MPNEVQYFVSPHGDGFEAFFHGQKVGEITFVRVGFDKLIVDRNPAGPFQQRGSSS